MRVCPLLQDGCRIDFDYMRLNESQTRSHHIDPQLAHAGWSLNDRSLVRREIPVDGYDAEPWNGVTDYCLYQSSGNFLAVVEAKRCSRNPREADEQLRHYVTEIAKRQPFAPFGFMANGHDTWFWEVGLTNPRLVAGFFTPADLERLLFSRQHRLSGASHATFNRAITTPSKSVSSAACRKCFSRAEARPAAGRPAKANHAA